MTEGEIQSVLLENAELKRRNAALQTMVEQQRALLRSLRMIETRPEKSLTSLFYDTPEAMAQLSHELRTPLHAILGFSRYLDSPDLSPLQRESLAYIHQGGQDLLAWVDRVLAEPPIEALRAERPTLTSQVAHSEIVWIGATDHDVERLRAAWDRPELLFIDVVPHGQEAATTETGREPFAILLDWPESDEVARATLQSLEFSSFNQSVPLIVLARSRSVEFLNSNRIAAFVEKPVEWRSLIVILRQFLGKQAEPPVE